MKRFYPSSFVALSFLLAAPGCGSGTADTTGSTANSGGATTGTSTGGAGGIGGDGGSIVTDHGKATALAITPSPGAIECMDGMPASLQFQAKATFEDGYQGSVDPSWSFDKLTLALVDGTGLVTANGSLGGQGTLTASFSGINATAPVTVKLTITDNAAGLTPEELALFDTPNGSPSGTLLYPYDKTVFARGLLPPEMMWAGGAPGDVYLVHVQQQFVDAKFYVMADPPSDFKMSEPFWTALTQSNTGEDVVVDVQRLSGGQAFEAMHETWKVAQGSLRGSIYYWAVNTGQLMKIAPGASSPTVVFDSGPADQLGTPAPANYNGAMPPWESGGGGKRCVACHTVSKDGSTIAAVFEKNGSTASPWGTIDLTQEPPAVTQVTPYDSNTIYLGLSPDGKFAVQNSLTMKLALADAKTGAAIPGALDAIADKVADPAFSQDGKMLAFS